MYVYIYIYTTGRKEGSQQTHIGDTLANGVGDVTAQEKSAQELEDRSEADGLRRGPAGGDRT